MTPRYLFSALLPALLLLSACQGRKQPAAPQKPTTEVADTTSADQSADSTIYGVSDEFGMSTFTLISDEGDTLYVTRTAEDGTYGKIYGDLKEGERYAMTTRDGGEALDVLINLTELDRHLKDYEISNGHVIVKGDTVEIESLSEKALKLKGKP